MTEAPSARRRPTRPPGTVGLYLSAGEAPTAGRNYPRKLDYIRPKPGRDEQFLEYAEKFTAAYGPTPRSVDVLFVSDRIGDVLDVRPKLYGTSGIRAVGFENLAELDRDDFLAALDAYDWELETRPEGQPEPGTYKLKGRDDLLVTRHKLKVYGTLRVAIPKVTGLMLLAEIATTSSRTIVNWYDNLRQALFLTGGVLVGIPHELRLRPARTTYFDAKEKKRKSSEFYEWVLESAYDLGTLQALVRERKDALAAGTAPLAELPPVRHDDPVRDEELTESLWRADEERRARRAASDLPSPGEEEAVREEPRAGADDALLNRIARLEEKVGRDGALVTLRGQYGVEDARDLDLEDATRYAETLERAAAVEDELDFVEAEVVEESEEDAAEEEATEVADATGPSDQGAGEAEGTDGAPALPGEPEDGSPDPDPDAIVDLAGEQLVPAGRHIGKTVAWMAQNKPQWIKWALRNPGSFVGEENFLAAVELYTRTRFPDVWEAREEES